MKDSVKSKLSRVGANQAAETSGHKKPDNKMTMNFETFKQLGKNGRLRKLMQQEPEEQAKVLSKLDPEARRAFKGLIGLTSDMTKKVEPKTPETVEEVFREEPATRVDRVFDGVRLLMTAMARNEFKEAYECVRKLMANHELDNSARTVLVPVGNAIARLYRNASGTVALLEDARENLINDINERLSNLLSSATYDAETIAPNDFDFIGQIETNVPAIVEETTHVTGITLVVLPDRSIPIGNRVRALTSGVYLIDATLIGVNTDLSEEDRVAAADAYALEHLRSSIVSTKEVVALTRPDSDAVWFPVFNHPGLEPIRAFGVEIVQFPDQARRYYGATEASNEMEAAARNAKIIRLRAQRAAFEAANATDFADLNWAQTEVTDCNSEALALGATFYERYSLRWQVPLPEIIAHFEARRDDDLDTAGDAVERRYNIHTMHERKIEAIAEEQRKIIDLRLRVRTAKKTVARLTELLEARKREMRDPYGVQIGDQIAAFGRTAAAA